MEIRTNRDLSAKKSFDLKEINNFETNLKAFEEKEMHNKSEGDLYASRSESRIADNDNIDSSLIKNKKVLFNVRKSKI